LTRRRICCKLATMRAQLQCASCIIDDLQGALWTEALDKETQFQILREAMLWLGNEFDEEHIPSYYITRVHRLLKERTGNQMPFRELRGRCNKAGIATRERVAEQLAKVSDDEQRLLTLILWAIAGNHLDFRTVGTGYDLATEDIAAQLSAVVSKGLTIDDTDKLLTIARQKPRVLYLADNVGEIALDTLLVRELQRHGCRVTVAVKGGPITSDAIMEDAMVVGMDQVAPIILTGPDTLGLPLDEMSLDLQAELEAADLVVSKGQANYYACSELVRERKANFMCVLCTKCIVAAQSLGVEDARANVAVLLRE